MTVSYNWLREYLDCDLTPERIAEALTDIGLEVERFTREESIRGGLEGVVVGRVLTCEKHPDADRLHVTTVDVGADEPLQIVCGAPNVAARQSVVVATVGATLYPKGEEDGFKIKKSKIRGVESLGMICAEDELGIGGSHDGIMVLGSAPAPGMPAAEALAIEHDYIYEIGLTPNRVDAASHYGVARDLAAWLRAGGQRCRLSLPDVGGFKEGVDKGVAVEVFDTEGAIRYSGVTLTGVKIAPSPDWMQRRLRAIGINPKNNVVDITNYVLHETGQPLHAFDAAHIGGGRIVVRKAGKGEKFTTLDGVERTLDSEDMMVCDTQRPMAIAGVLGGLDSGVSDATTSVFIESATFNPQRVRKTARRHGINTDASFRFERGSDPDMTIYAMKRAALLMVEYAGAKVASPVEDVYPVKAEPHRFELSLDFMERLVGKRIPEDTVRKILEGLEVKVGKEEGDAWQVSVPPCRVDVTRQADLIEDILRIYGYNNVEIPVRMTAAVGYAPHPDKDKLVEMTGDMLSARGFAEIMSNSLTSASYYEGSETFPVERCVRILNPLSTELNVMRQTLLFNMLEAVRLNANRRHADLKFYEFGNVYTYDEAKRPEGGLAPYGETYKLAIGITGLRHEPSWNTPAVRSDLFALRGELERLLARFGIDMGSLQQEPVKSDVFTNALSVWLNGRELMRFGAVSREVAAKFDLKNDMFFAEIDFTHLVKATRKHAVRAQELSKYPEVRRDLALLVDREVTFGRMRDAAFAAEKKLLNKVSLFDVYEGDKLPAGKKSYAMSFILEDKTKTLTDKEIERIMENIATRLAKDCGAEIRQQ